MPINLNVCTDRRLLRSILLPAVLVCHGCAASTDSSEITAANAAVSSDQLWQQYAAIPKAEKSAAATKLRAMTLTDYIEATIAQADNQPLSIDGVKIDNAKTILISKRHTFSDLSVHFPNLGSLWNHFGDQPLATEDSQFSAAIQHLLHPNESTIAVPLSLVVHPDTSTKWCREQHFNVRMQDATPFEIAQELNATKDRWAFGDLSALAAADVAQWGEEYLLRCYYDDEGDVENQLGSVR